MDSRLFKGNHQELNENESLLDKKILIVDDQSFNIDAALIIMNTSLRLDTDKLCALAINGR